MNRCDARPVNIAAAEHTAGDTHPSQPLTHIREAQTGKPQRHVKPTDMQHCACGQGAARVWAGSGASIDSTSSFDSHDMYLVVLWGPRV